MKAADVDLGEKEAAIATPISGQDAIRQKKLSSVLKPVDKNAATLILKRWAAGFFLRFKTAITK